MISLGNRIGYAGNRFRSLLATPVDGASLAMFRICYGLVIAWEAVRYLWPGLDGSKVERLYAATAWNFPYSGFEWVRPWPEPFMTLHFVLLGLAGLCLALGLCYRTSAVTVAVLLTYIFLLDEANYLNHFYLMCLFSFLLIWMPAQACFSLDAWRRGLADQPDGRPGCVPFWPIFLLRAQLFIVYFYGGIAKINADWLAGTPLWGTGKFAMDLLAQLLTSGQMETLQAYVDYKDFAWMIAIGGLTFDLAIGFLLLFRRTRILAIVLTAIFHAFNNQAFSIGVFPVLAFTATLIFFDADWPRTLWTWIRRPRIARPDLAWLAAGAVAVPVLGAALGWKVKRTELTSPRQPVRLPPGVVGFVLAWLAIQILLPLRHHAISGDVAWTEEGHRFSWRMMLRAKDGFIRFGVVDSALFVTNASGKTQVNWPEWTKKYPRVMHASVDVHNLPWTKLPKLMVIFEPLAGERVVFNPHAAGSTTPENARRQLEDGWQRLYGRKPRIYSTVTIAEAIDAIHGHVTQAGSTGRSNGATPQFMATLQQAQKVAAVIPENLQDSEDRAATLDRLLGTLLADDDFGAVVHEQVSRTHPFTLQGRQHSGPPLLAVEDPGLQSLNGHRRGQLNRKLWKQSPVVYLDVSRMRYEGWVNLPQALIYFKDGQPRMQWNHHAELNPRQIRKMQVRPYMVHQYAQHIAGRWEEQFGRRPEVYATTSLMAVNHAPAQPLIDPQVDLASAPMKLLGHNDWILPLKALRPSSATELAASAVPEDTEDSDGLALQYSPGKNQVEEQVEWRDGKKYTTVTLLTPTGQPSKRVTFCDGVPHGATTMWHSNGRLANQINFQNGKQEGKATVWYENGQKSWEGQFRDGKLNGLAIGWRGDGRKTEQAEFQNGVKLGHQPVRYADGGKPAGRVR